MKGKWSGERSRALFDPGQYRLPETFQSFLPPLAGDATSLTRDGAYVSLTNWVCLCKLSLHHSFTKMLSLSLRAAKCIPRYCRTMSTMNDQKILTEAFDELGLAKSAPAASPTTTTSYRSSGPPILDIPPAEDPLLRYLTSSLTQHGHRARAARIVSQTLMHLHAWTRAPPLPILRQAILDAAPAVRTLNHRQGGKTIYKPVALGEKQRTRKAVQAILTQVEKKQGRLPEKLAREIMGILRGDKDNAVLRKKDEMHRHAMVNRCVLYNPAKKTCNLTFFSEGTFKRVYRSVAL